MSLFHFMFYVPAAVALVSTVLVIVSPNAIHALLYLILSLLSVSLVFFALGAPFLAALEVIVYAGAIMVLFVFVVMMLNLGKDSAREERAWLRPAAWIGPGVLAAVLLTMLVAAIARGAVPPPAGLAVFEPRDVALALFGPYVLGVELVSLLLLAGLVGAYHLGRRART